MVHLKSSTIMSRQAVSDALAMIKGMERVGKQTAKLQADILEKAVEGTPVHAPLKQARTEIENILNNVEVARPEIESKLQDSLSQTLDSTSSAAMQVQSLADIAAQQANVTVQGAGHVAQHVAQSAQKASQDVVNEFSSNGVAGLANVATTQAAAIFDGLQQLSRSATLQTEKEKSEAGESESDAILKEEMMKWEEELARTPAATTEPESMTESAMSYEEVAENSPPLSDSAKLTEEEIAKFQEEARKMAESMAGTSTTDFTQKRKYSTWSAFSSLAAANRRLHFGRFNALPFANYGIERHLFLSSVLNPVAAHSSLLLAVNQIGIAAHRLDFSAMDTDSQNKNTKTPIKPPKASDLKLKKNRPKLSDQSRENRVPSGRMERLASYGGLGAGLAVGAIAEITKRAVGISAKKADGADSSIFDASVILSAANAERIVNTLCRVRGAALKLGQMLSIADNSLISPELQAIFERVRQGADFMPWNQTESQLESQLGKDWREKVASFDEKPFAAASIGQVHLAELHNGKTVAVKIQYPGVAEGIDSDITNLVAILSGTRLVPETLFLDEMMRVARREMAWEVDYRREKAAYVRFREFLQDDPVLHVPQVIDELSSSRVLTTEFVEGIPLDMVAEIESQETRNLVGESILRLTLKELFEWRCMQTDPNYANFLFGAEENKIGLLDFGASRYFTTKFVDDYVRIINSAAIGDRDGILHWSKEVGFLTGYEAAPLLDAHVDAIMILGEAFQKDAPFDFGNANTVARITNIIPAILAHRLTHPPEDVYSLHRKMAGVFLLCTKLKCNMNIKHLWDNIWSQYEFGRADLPEALAQKADVCAQSLPGN